MGISLLTLVNTNFSRVGVDRTRQIYFVSQGLHLMLRVKRTGEFSKWLVDRWPTAVKKNGNSEPSEAAMLSRSDGESGNCHHRRNASRIAAASLLPPPNPAAMGIRLYNSIRTP